MGETLRTAALRQAVPADAAAVVRLLRAEATGGLLGIDPSSLDGDVEAQRLARQDPRQACMLVTEVAGGVQGFGLAVRGPGPALDHTATVSLLVAPSCRRHGLGRLLLEGLEAWARSARVHKLCAGVHAGNAAALALFQNAGYSTEGIRRQQLRSGETLADEVCLGLFPAGGGTGR